MKVARSGNVAVVTLTRGCASHRAGACPAKAAVMRARIAENGEAAARAWRLAGYEIWANPRDGGRLIATVELSWLGPR